MHSDIEETNELSDELSKLDREITRVQVIALPGWAAIGLGIYGFFSEGNAFISLLNNESFSIGLILFGAYLAVWEARKIFPLYKQRKELDP